MRLEVATVKLPVEKGRIWSTVAAHRCLGVLTLYGWFRASMRRMPAKSIRLGSWGVVTGPDSLQLILRQ